MATVVNLTGRVFGRLTVVRLDHTDRNGAFWECKCSCGKTKIIRGSSLKEGDTKSCGCLYTDASRLESKRRHPDSNAFHNLFRRYKYTANKYGRDFALSEERFAELTQRTCSYCGKEPCQESKTATDSYIYNGIDRIDSLKGYVEGNVVSCCVQCNTAKNKYTQPDFFGWIKRVYEHSLTNL